MQSSFHPYFNFNKLTLNNQSVRLDYKRVENRCLFIVLFKHISFVGGKSCYLTAFELSKLLLSLDAENDPLGAILLLDFYAMRSCQYEFLVEFYDTFNSSKHLSLMPNFALSVALAHYCLYKRNNKVSHLDAANKLLTASLVQFPCILMELLDKCGVQPDKKVESHWIFSKLSHYE